MEKEFTYYLKVEASQKIEFLLDESQINEIKELISNCIITDDEGLFNHLMENMEDYDYEYGIAEDMIGDELYFVYDDYFEQLKNGQDENQ
jgi:hypothetical protein